MSRKVLFRLKSKPFFRSKLLSCVTWYNFYSRTEMQKRIEEITNNRSYLVLKPIWRDLYQKLSLEQKSIQKIKK